MTPAASGGKRRRALSLRARLLAGLIALTTVFLVVMGVVSSLVLGKLEQDQFNAELKLAARQPIGQIAKAPDGFAASFLSLRTGAYGELTPSTGTSAELRDVLGPLSGQPAKDVDRYLRSLAARGTPFSLPVSGQPTLRVVWRPVGSTGRSADGPLPAGLNVILVGRPVSAVSSQVSGLVRTELITGAVLLALVAACGSWLIGRGLAPLGRMARTADLVTSSGDLTARMPDPNDDHETGRLAGAINTMLDRIQQAFGARLESEQKVRQFAADASHELRTPLTTIRGYAELYRQGALGPGELPNAMRRIEQEADRMSMLVAELLELARLDRASSLDLTETDLAALARDAVADALAVEPGRPVTADVPPSLVVTADEPRIRQVLANLLGNVRAHTPPGTAATVRLYRADGGAVLEVADGGPGMSERDAARAFDRFHRGARGGDATGSGLGLSIVAAIAAAHGGYARLRSAPGAGTTVHLWIPVNFPERQGVAVSGPRKSLAGTSQIPRVLPSSATSRPRRGGEAGGMTNIYQGHGPAKPPTGRGGRRRRWAAVLAVTAVVAGGGAFAAAEAATGSPAAPAALAAGTQSAATTQADTSAQAAVLNSALNGRGRLRRLSGMYGQFTFETKKGARTLAFERGTIESVSGDDVVVRAKNGTTWRWTLTSESAVREDGKRGADGDLKPGELVFAGGPVTGPTRDVRLIVIRKATAGAGQPTA